MKKKQQQQQQRTNQYNSNPRSTKCIVYIYDSWLAVYLFFDPPDSFITLLIAIILNQLPLIHKKTHYINITLYNNGSAWSSSNQREFQQSVKWQIW